MEGCQPDSYSLLDTAMKMNTNSTLYNETVKTESSACASDEKIRSKEEIIHYSSYPVDSNMSNDCMKSEAPDIVTPKKRGRKSKSVKSNSGSNVSKRCKKDVEVDISPGASGDDNKSRNKRVKCKTERSDCEERENSDAQSSESAEIKEGTCMNEDKKYNAELTGSNETKESGNTGEISNPHSDVSDETDKSNNKLEKSNSQASDSPEHELCSNEGLKSSSSASVSSETPRLRQKRKHPKRLNCSCCQKEDSLSPNLNLTNINNKQADATPVKRGRKSKNSQKESTLKDKPPLKVVSFEDFLSSSQNACDEAMNTGLQFKFPPNRLSGTKLHPKYLDSADRLTLLSNQTVPIQFTSVINEPAASVPLMTDAEKEQLKNSAEKPSQNLTSTDKCEVNSAQTKTSQAQDSKMSEQMSTKFRIKSAFSSGREGYLINGSVSSLGYSTADNLSTTTSRTAELNQTYATKSTDVSKPQKTKSNTIRGKPRKGASVSSHSGDLSDVKSKKTSDLSSQINLGVTTSDSAVRNAKEKSLDAKVKSEPLTDSNTETEAANNTSQIGTCNSDSGVEASKTGTAIAEEEDEIKVFSKYGKCSKISFYTFLNKVCFVKILSTEDPDQGPVVQS